MTLEGKARALAGISLLGIVVTFAFFAPIEQPAAYHDFADGNRHFGIPNFANVASNLAYLIPGLMGLYLVHGAFMEKQKFLDPREALPFYLVFLGSVALAFGSGYYHLIPNNETLVADRLTMTVGFMGVLSFVIAERISVKWGLRLLPALLTVGLFSVIYWIYTELQSAGDLRLYGLVQFLPLIAVPAMLLAFPARYSGVKYIWLALGSYAAAKLFEQLDGAIWELTQHLLSGHTLKHLVSGLGIYFLLLYVRKRQVLPG
ncbi:MAG: alkaline phytoceramidase [Proteobacteria bacterium]|nr:alkaline phytoceramidase [Pseudomonadota bacterium]